MEGVAPAKTSQDTASRVPTRNQKPHHLAPISLDIYPNPFNSATKVRFTLGLGSQVTIGLFDVLGREVLPVARKYFDPGEHEIELDASNLASGVYLLTMKAGETLRTQKMLLAR